MQSFSYRRIVGVGLIGLAATVGSALATPGLNIDGVNLGRGTIENNGTIVARDAREVRIREAADRSDALFQRITIAPGGHSGWHSHPSPTWIVVLSGELAHYDPADPRCSARKFGPGAGFFQSAGEVHIVRNEGTTAAEFLVFYSALRPGAGARIDEPQPANCP